MRWQPARHGHWPAASSHSLLTPRCSVARCTPKCVSPTRMLEYLPQSTPRPLLGGGVRRRRRLQDRLRHSDHRGSWPDRWNTKRLWQVHHPLWGKLPLHPPAPRIGELKPCNYEAHARYCTFANSWSTPCREHSTCLYLCTVLLLRLVHET